MRDHLARGRNRLGAKCRVERGSGLVGDEACGVPAPPGRRFGLGDHAGDVGDLPGFELSQRCPQLDRALAGGRVVDPAAHDPLRRGVQLLITSPRRGCPADADFRPRTLHPGPIGEFDAVVRTYRNLSVRPTRTFLVDVQPVTLAQQATQHVVNPTGSLRTRHVAVRPE